VKTCRCCWLDKPLSEFYVNRTKGKDGYQTWCKRCQAIRRNENQKARRAEDPAVAAKQAQWMRDAVRATVVEIRFLLGDVCAECGDDNVLDIDHVENDGVAHRAQFGGSGLSYYRDVLRLIKTGEAHRFQLLCKRHHGQRTRRVAASASV
jgi:hypothetical protein